MKKKLKILATCQYGWPEPYPSLYPMEEMVKRGHFVQAVTGIPNYPMGEVFDGYEKNNNKHEIHNGVHITHVTVIPRKKDVIHRLFNYHSYPIFAKREINRLAGDFDVVYANQSSPVMMVEPAITYAKKWNKRVVMYCMDLWPASLCVGGIKKNSLLYKYYYNTSKKIYNNVDVILVTSRMFKDYFINEFGIPEHKIDYLPQYALSAFDYIPKQEKKVTTDFVFAGNIGKAQNIEVILRAAKLIAEQGIADQGKTIYFHIIGDGQALADLQNFAQMNCINNVVFHGRKPLSEMPKFYSRADAMIVSLLPDHLISMTLPAKVQSYMAAGKAIIASANGEISNVIKESGCGFCAKADDEEDLVSKIKMFLNLDTENRKKLGIMAKDYYEKNFAVDVLMDKLEKILYDNSI